MSDKGDLHVKATMDSSGFNASLNNMKMQAQKFGQEVSSGLGHSFIGIGAGLSGGIVGMIGLGGFISSLERLVGKASGIREVAEEMEATTDSVQKMEKAIRRFDGLSMSKFQGIVSKINEARIAAFTDPKERAKFAAIGISPQDLLNTAGIDPMAFTAKVYAGGEGGAAAQAKLAAIVGTKGTRYGPAVALAAQMTPDFSEKQLDQFHDIHIKEQEVGNWFTRAWASFWGNVISGITDPLTPGAKRFGRGFMKVWNGVPEGPPSAPSTMVPYRGHTKDGGEISDPMDVILEKQRKEFLDKQDEALAKQRAAERGNMSIGDRRKSIQAELSSTRKQINTMEKFIGPLTEEDTFKLISLRTKAAGLTHELPKESPMSFSADSLAKVGGFTSSTVGFNPIVNIQQAQLQVLNRIATNTQPGRGSFHQ